MRQIPFQQLSPVWRRTVWLLVAGTLLLTVVAIYLYLRPPPRKLAEPEEVWLRAGESFELTELPMGMRYRLRACGGDAEVQVQAGTWRSNWTVIRSNAGNNPALDLLIDGRSGGTLRVEARNDTGKMWLFRHRQPLECGGGATQAEASTPESSPPTLEISPTPLTSPLPVTP